MTVCISHNPNFIITYILYHYDDHIYSMKEFEPNILHIPKSDRIDHIHWCELKCIE